MLESRVPTTSAGLNAAEWQGERRSRTGGTAFILGAGRSAIVAGPGRPLGAGVPILTRLIQADAVSPGRAHR